MALTDNGYYTFSNTGDSTYHFYLKDHQGNNRVVVSQSGSVEQTDYNGMIPTFEEGAALANHVYEGMENEQVGDWTCISITVNKSNGLRYGIYSHKKDT